MGFKWVGKVIPVTDPVTAARLQSEDLALRLKWFERVGYGAEIAALDAESDR